MQHLAPIALFVYNRPEHTRRTLAFLQKNLLADESRLFIYSDAPADESDREKVKKPANLSITSTVSNRCASLNVRKITAWPIPLFPA